MKSFKELPLIGKFAYLVGLLCMIPVGYMLYLFLSFTLPIILVFLIYGSVIVLGVWALVFSVKSIVSSFHKTIK